MNQINVTLNENVVVTNFTPPASPPAASPTQVAVELPSTEITIVTVGEQGPPGPVGAQGPSGATIQVAVNQAHSFVQGDAVYYDGSAWGLAIATSLLTCATHIVSSVVDGSNFIATQAGYVTHTAHGLSLGGLYYLSALNPGKLTLTPPTEIKQTILRINGPNNYFVIIGPPQLREDGDVIQDLGSQTGAVTVNLNNGRVVVMTLTGDVSLTFTNWPNVSRLCRVTMFFIQDATGNHNVTFPGGYNGDPFIPGGANFRNMSTLLSYDGGVTVDYAQGK